MNQAWFEMKDVRPRWLDASVWIPLREVNAIDKSGRFGFSGFKEDFYGVGTIAVPAEKKEAVKKKGWSDIGISHSQRPYVQEGRYIPSDTYEDYQGMFSGVHFVLEQTLNGAENKEWHLHQDLVIGLGLKREGDTWVCPDEGYIDVVRLKRTSQGAPWLIEIRAEYLKDYLCGRGMALYATSYRQRTFIAEDASHISWLLKPSTETTDHDRWEGQVMEIHEGGEPFGTEVAVFHASRTDVHPKEDVPVLGPPTDANIESRSWTKGFKGRKLYRISGELWRNEWVEPAKTSPRIRGDKVSSEVSFIIDAEGTREKSEALKESGRWLWFRPNVIMALAHQRGGSLGWYTKDTGQVKCSPDYPVHFGVNSIGLVNVYAKDIALLPEWQQRIWVGHNLGPEGGVSEELLASQVKAVPADTQAPEEYLPKGLKLLNSISVEELGFALLREHEEKEEILTRTHRFRAIDKVGLFSLAKDLARLTADSLDTVAMQKVVAPPKGVKWGSLKALENLLAKKSDAKMARALTGPLVGIYELRHADAHLPSSENNEALALVGVDQSLPSIIQGYLLLNTCVTCLYEIIDILRPRRTAST